MAKLKESPIQIDPPGSSNRPGSPSGSSSPGKLDMGSPSRLDMASPSRLDMASPSRLDTVSPSKLVMSPGMPIFPVSPERAAGTRPPYSGPTPQSPSLPELRTSPIRKHRRGDSSVSSLASMFENLGVKDPKDVHAGYVQAMEKQRAKHTNEMQDLQRKYENAIARLEIRNEELRSEIKEVRNHNADTITRSEWDKYRQEHRQAIGKWEERMRWSEENRKSAEAKLYEYNQMIRDLKGENSQLRKEGRRLHTEALRRSDMIPTLQTKIESLQRNARLLESDIKHKSDEADKYKNMVYTLEVDLESVSARLGEEVQTLQDKLRLVESERDALKTNLREEEVLRIAAEGRIPLPVATTEEVDEFASPVRSPRKQASPERDENKENVAPRKLAVELKFLEQDLATERRLRERAQDQIEFMKMECQFRCCSCRIADLKGANFVHDGGYADEMERIKSSLPELTPPPSDHGDDRMDVDVPIKQEPEVVIKQEPMDDDRPLTPPKVLAEFAQPPVQQIVEQKVELSVSSMEEAELAFSPTTGTFKSVPSPAKAPASTHVATPAKPTLQEAAEITGLSTDSSPWNPDANSTVFPTERNSLPRFSLEAGKEALQPQSKARPSSINIHHDAIADSDREDLHTPLEGPPGPATPAHWMMRTITTTTTIPLHFSPATPAIQSTNSALTPSTVAHAPTDAQSHALGEVSLNALPFDREAALEAIRQRRGRARSMQIGQATPGKQMLEGVKDRRDISEPVFRVRR